MTTNKGLEALEVIKETIAYFGAYTERAIESCNIIEKELKEADKNKEVLDIFKNALTIEHRDPIVVEHDDTQDSITYIVKTMYQIKQRELDNDLRKALREWVLKNAFPKEVKMLEVLEKHFDIEVYHSRHTETGYELSLTDADRRYVAVAVTEEEVKAIAEGLRR